MARGPRVGQPCAKLCSSLAWWEGPDWLRLPQDYGPRQPVLNEPTEDRLTEMKSLETKALLCVESDNEVALERIVAAYLLQTCETLRITALVIRFVENLKKMMNIENRELELDELASDEVEKIIRGKDGPDRPDGPDVPHRPDRPRRNAAGNADLIRRLDSPMDLKMIKIIISENLCSNLKFRISISLK